jgi:hypothetical protein
MVLLPLPLPLQLLFLAVAQAKTRVERMPQKVKIPEPLTTEQLQSLKEPHHTGRHVH